MPKLMPYLIINYPNPELFLDALEATFEFAPNFLELQLPFSNPVADGPVIWQADQKALKYTEKLEESLAKIQQVRKKFPNCRTELILMSYVSRIVFIGTEKVAELLEKYNFYGLVSPDMTFGSPEQKFFTNFWKNKKPALVPVISPLTGVERLKKIKTQLKSGQMVYPTARIGITGQKTSLDSPEILAYFDWLKSELKEYLVAVGFGISSFEQVKKLDKMGFVAVVATEIIKRIEQTEPNKSAIYLAIKKVLAELHGLNS